MDKMNLKRKAAIILSLLSALVLMPAGGAAAADNKPGDKLGNVYYTNIRAYINGNELPSYNVNDYMCIKIADLNNYGFDVTYDSAARAAYVACRARVMPR